MHWANQYFIHAFLNESGDLEPSEKEERGAWSYREGERLGKEKHQAKEASCRSYSHCSAAA